MRSYTCAPATLDNLDPFLQFGVLCYQVLQDLRVRLQPLPEPQLDLLDLGCGNLPETLIGRVIAPLTDGTSYDIWMMQTDGVVIYDTTPEEIGKNLFSDPAYRSPALQEAFSRIAAEPSGSLTYSFWDTDWAQTVTKEAVWGTAGVDGTEWRVVVTRNVDA